MERGRRGGGRGFRAWSNPLAAFATLTVLSLGAWAAGRSAPAAAIDAHAFRKAGALTFVSQWPDVPALTLEMPCRYDAESNPDEDYDTHYAYCERLPGHREESGLGIYVGYYPSTFRSRDDHDVKKTRGQIGDERISWYGWTETGNNGPVLMREAIVEDFFEPPDGESNPDLDELLLHIWVYGSTEAEVAALQAAVATMVRIP